MRKYKDCEVIDGSVLPWDEDPQKARDEFLDLVDGRKIRCHYYGPIIFKKWNKTSWEFDADESIRWSAADEWIVVIEEEE